MARVDTPNPLLAAPAAGGGGGGGPPPPAAPPTQVCGLFGSDTHFTAVRSTAPSGRAEGSVNWGSDPKNPSQLRVAFLLGTFLWRKKRNAPRPPGRDPAHALQQGTIATIKTIAASAMPESVRDQKNKNPHRPPPAFSGAVMSGPDWVRRTRRLLSVTTVNTMAVLGPSR